MSPTFTLLAALTVASAIATMSLRNLVHCALALAVAFAGLAGLYLRLDAQFVGFAQVLVYVGAVAILIVFAILLTRGSGPPDASETRPRMIPLCASASDGRTHKPASTDAARRIIMTLQSE